MSININMSVQRLVPQFNDQGLTLVIFKNAALNAGRGEIVRVDSHIELLNAFSDSDPVSVKAFRELYSAEYLARAGVSLLCYSTNAVGTFDSTDVIKILDQKELDYKFIVMPYDFVKYDIAGSTVPTELLAMVSTLSNNVDAELYLDLSPDTDADNIAALKTDLATVTPKVELFINSGFPGFVSQFTMPTGIDSISETNIAEDGSFVADTSFVGIPASLAVIARKAKLLENGTPWIPVAGETNGRVPEFTTLYRRVYTEEKETFQSENINVLVSRRGVGSLLVSQNTLADDTRSSNPLIRSHVVTEALWLKRQIDFISNKFYHTPNNQKSWDLINLKMARILNRAKEKEGIESFSVVVGLGKTMTQEDITNGILRVNISYLPIRVIEKIEFNVLIKESEDMSDIIITGGEL